MGRVQARSCRPGYVRARASEYNLFFWIGISGALDFLPAVKSLAGRLTRFSNAEVAATNPRWKGQRRGGRPDLIKRRAVLAAVQTASRRLWRWPLASLDRRSARRGEIMQAGAEKRHTNRTEKLSISSASISACGKSVQVDTIEKRMAQPSRIQGVACVLLERRELFDPGTMRSFGG